MKVRNMVIRRFPEDIELINRVENCTTQILHNFSLSKQTFLTDIDSELISQVNERKAAKQVQKERSSEFKLRM